LIEFLEVHAHRRKTALASPLALPAATAIPAPPAAKSELQNV
jgi:hypothetical protein